MSKWTIVVTDEEEGYISCCMGEFDSEREAKRELKFNTKDWEDSQWTGEVVPLNELVY